MHSSFHTTSFSKRASGDLRSGQAGFTLIEMMIVIAIMLILGAVVIFQYRLFDSQLLLRNLAYEIALTVRESQTLGIGVRGTSGVFTAAHGVRFEPGTTYRIFRDDNRNNRYDADETLSTFTIERNNRIADLCVDGVCGRSSLDIMFQRPDPDARFYPPGSDAQITVAPQSGSNSRTINVTATGQISVQ